MMRLFLKPIIAAGIRKMTPNIKVDGKKKIPIENNIWPLFNRYFLSKIKFKKDLIISIFWDSSKTYWDQSF